MKKKKILKHFLLSAICFLFVNGLTYLFSYLELGFENFTTNLIINNLTAFFVIIVVILFKEVKFFYTEDTDPIEFSAFLGLLSALFLFVAEISYSWSGAKNFFLACSMLMPFCFSLAHIKLGIVNLVTITTVLIFLRFFFALEMVLENYFYYLIVFLSVILAGHLIKILYLFVKKIIKFIKPLKVDGETIKINYIVETNKKILESQNRLKKISEALKTLK